MISKMNINKRTTKVNNRKMKEINGSIVIKTIKLTVIRKIFVISFVKKHFYYEN